MLVFVRGWRRSLTHCWSWHHTTLTLCAVQAYKGSHVQIPIEKSIFKTTTQIWTFVYKISKNSLNWQFSVNKSPTTWDNLYILVNHKIWCDLCLGTWRKSCQLRTGNKRLSDQDWIWSSGGLTDSSTNSPRRQICGYVIYTLQQAGLNSQKPGSSVDQNWFVNGTKTRSLYLH